MYRILLVDDEYFYREALKNTILWEDCGCYICGEANNGMIGVEKAKEFRPDIILADVSMPFMDGLQMIEAIQKDLPEVLFAIVTGYSEFEYAKRGIELGVKYFVLKPVDDKELVKCIGEIVQELDARKRKKKEYTSLRFWADKNVKINQRDFLQMLLDGDAGISLERFEYECESLQLPIQNGGYVVCCLRVDMRAPIKLTNREWEEMIQKMLDEELPDQKYVLNCTNRCMRILFYNISLKEWDGLQIRVLLQKLQIKCMNELVCTVVGGMGNLCRDYTEIAGSCAVAEGSMTEVVTSDLISRMLQYIHKNYSDADLTLQKIADALYSNYSYLSAQFTREIGMSASQYILRFRMAKAADVLRNGEENMVQIAGNVGYTDVKYFYRCFKKEFGITPYQYIDAIHKNREDND